MHITKQVITLQQAQELKDLGISDNQSLYGYVKLPNDGYGFTSYVKQ